MLRQGTGELQLGYLQELGSFSGGDSSLTKQLQSYQLPLAVSPVAPVDCPTPPANRVAIPRILSTCSLRSLPPATRKAQHLPDRDRLAVSILWSNQIPDSPLETKRPRRRGRCLGKQCAAGD